jgi:hypothetical protein
VQEEGEKGGGRQEEVQEEEVTSGRFRPAGAVGSRRVPPAATLAARS